MKKIMTKTDMKGIHGGGRLKQRIAEHLRASRAVVSMSTAGVTAEHRMTEVRLGDDYNYKLGGTSLSFADDLGGLDTVIGLFTSESGSALLYW